MLVGQVLYSGLGGHGSVAFSLAKAMPSFGCSTAMVFVGIEPLLPTYRVMASDLRIDHRAVRTHPGFAWLGWAAVYRALVQLRPDAIVLHSVKMVLPCVAYAKLRGIPVLAVEHQANALKRRSEWWVSRCLMRLADEIVVLTPSYRRQLQDGLGGSWRGEKVQVIPNGVDTTVFAPNHRSDVASGPRTIGMAARITSIKRHDLLVDAVALLCARDGVKAWRLTFAGEGDAVADLRARIRRRGLEDVVMLAGFLDETRLVEWFRGLHVYAHASEGETLSTSVLQAMAMGLPIVGSDVPGIGDLLEAGGGVGMSVAQTPEAFADAFTRLRQEETFASELGARASRLVELQYSQHAMAASYLKRLEVLCAG